MTAPARWTRIGLRRYVALTAVGRRQALRPTLVAPGVAGPAPLADVEQRLADYLLDRCARPLVARGPADPAWFEHSLLLAPVAPGSALAVADDLAAIVAAPRLIAGGRLSERALAARFASRADDAIAAAVALLAPDAAVAAIYQLAAHHGRDEDQLHLAVLQAGGALAWCPELLDADGVGELVDALLGLLDRASPKPLLDAVAPILGAIAASPGATARRSADTVLARLGAARRRMADRRSGASFLDEFRALDRSRALPDEDYVTTLPDRQLAEAAAQILGRAAAALAPDGFIAVQTEVLGGELGSALLPAFVDGLIAGAAVAPLTELTAHLLAASDAEPRLLGLQIAAQLPLDGCAEACLACLDDSRWQIRTSAVRAVSLLEPARAVPALTARLDDPAPAVGACAARALIGLGHREPIEARRMPGGLSVGTTRERTAAIRAALLDPSSEVVAMLLPLAAAEAEHDPAPGDTPLVAALAAILRGSADGIALAAAVVREIPEALPIVALALAGELDTPSVALPAELRAQLARVLDPIIDAGGEAGMLALETLSRFSLGDPAMVERIAAAAAQTDGYAQQVLAALANVRQRSERAASLLAPWLDSHEHLGATIVAAAVAGVALPADHRLWAQICELFALGSVAAASAHGALVQRARIQCED